MIINLKFPPVILKKHVFYKKAFILNKNKCIFTPAFCHNVLTFEILDK